MSYTPNPSVVTRSHRCFPEFLQFFVHYVARNELRGMPFPDDELKIAGPPTSLSLTALCRVSETLAFLRGTGREPETFAFYEGHQRIALPGDQFGAPPEEPDVTYELPAGQVGPSLCLYLLGSAWERHADEVEALLPHKSAGKDKRPAPLVRDWPPDCAFFFHLRNACFHGGTFSIRPVHRHQVKPMPGWPDPSPAWGLHKMDFATIEGRRVFGPDGFLHVSDALPLLWDMGLAIDRVLSEPPA